MIKPLHRKLTTARWCALRLAVPSWDWNVCQQSCAEHWDGFTHAHPRSPTSYDEGLVAQMLGRGHPEKMGALATRCLPWGQGTPQGARSGPASLGLRCATVSVDNWVSPVSTGRHEGVMSRHSIRTVRAMLRPPFYHNAVVVVSAVRRGGGPCLDECSREVRGQALQGGSIGVLHTQGRTGPDHPPRPRLATRGGYADQGERWEPRRSWP
jgi:hypothetical protein